MDNSVFYLYHICREHDKYNLKEGYIGVSKKPSKRWSSGGYKQNPHLRNALSKYTDIVHYVVKAGTLKECLADEKKLRPYPNMGWNIASGGGLPPSPKGKAWCISNLPEGKRRQTYLVTESTRRKLSQANLKKSAELSLRMTGASNPLYGVRGADRPNFKGYYLTPRGRFSTSAEVEEAFGISKPTVQGRCKVGGVVGYSRWNPKDWTGKTWKELGWGFEGKGESNA